MMKNVAFISVLLLGLFFTSCLKDICDETRIFIQYEPIYLNENEIRTDISTEASRALNNPGKIYAYKEYLFINELQEGVHIINNSDPANPNNIGFIAIPGNVDVAVKDGYMYADNYMDLVTIDINNPQNSFLVCRDEDVYSNYYFQEGRGILVGYRETEIRAEVDCNDPNFNRPFFIQEDLFFGAPEISADAGGGNRSVSGTGGSLARFTVSKDHLYAIDEFNLYIFDVGKPEKPKRINDFYVEWGIETLFPHGDFLFIGANNGLHIYDHSTPARPQYVAHFRHATACDPVFVDDKYAYVTLRDGRDCESFSNQLDVIDISDIKDPTLLKSFQMKNPHGLSVRNDYLYLCEGDHGLKVFDASVPVEVGDHLQEHIKDVQATDVIALSDDLLLMIGQDGLYQYDISEPANPKEISFLSVSRTE